MSTFALSVAGFALAVVASLWNFGLTFVRWPLGLRAEDGSQRRDFEYDELHYP
jgi:hypothetical protein